MSGRNIARWMVPLIGAVAATAALAQAPGDLPPAATAATLPAADSGPLDYWSMLFVFMLATFIGVGVIRRVSRLLHTPLMSLTNAISAIAVVGSIIVTGSDHPLHIRILGAIALFASMTNIVSGFLLTDRMLKMFKGDGGKR
jgi:proton-translocating NAD(P)+ transhydrogenase subunit alpha